MKKLLAVAILMGAPAVSFAAPRTLGNGAPACGNVMSKSKQGCEVPLPPLELAKAEVTRAEYYEARALEALTTTPRTLANGAPACGNTMGGKSAPPPCTAERADELHQHRVDTAARAVADATAARAKLRALKQPVTRGARPVVAARTR